MKEDNIEICTLNCASLHSFLCMQRKAVKLKSFLRLKKQIGRLDRFFVEKVQTIII